MKHNFDQTKYWQSRVRGDIDLGVVGHRALGLAYNKHIYRRRVEVLTKVVDATGLNPAQSSILDIGCGSGFYVDFWHSLGVRELCAVDVSMDSITALQKKYVNDCFIQADMCAAVPPRLVDKKFSVITLFDVLYHIDDDKKVAALLRTVSTLLDANGFVLIFDMLCQQDYMLRSHVKFRARSSFLSLLREAGLTIEKAEPLFVLLEPPIYGRRWLDIVISGLYKIVGYPMRAWAALGDLLGHCVSQLDNRLRRLGVATPNHHLFVVRKIRG